MAGTDKSKAAADGTATRGLAGAAAVAPAVVLIEPQLGENIGMVARAMLNSGLTDLRLVRPRDGWPSESATKAASGADLVIERARLFASTDAAIAGCQRVHATTARPRGMVKRVITPRRAAGEMRQALAADESVAVLFGPERSGLVNDDIALADSVIQVPLNPAFASLNLAQAVLLVGYEWYQSGDATPAEQLDSGGARLVGKADLLFFFERLEAKLDAFGFLRPIEKRPNMVRNIRNIFQRTGLTEAELRTLHGIVSALTREKRPPDET